MAKFLTPLLIAGGLLCLILWLVGTPANAQGSSFSVGKSAPSQAKAGESFVYTIVVTNSSAFDINVDITDPIPSNVIMVNSGTGVYSATAGTLAWTGVSVGSGSSVQVSFTVRVEEAGDIINSDYFARSGPTTEYGPAATTTIVPNDPALIVIDAAPNPTTVDSSSVLTISLTDTYGNVVADNTDVHIDFDLGTIDGQAPGTTINATTSGGQVVKTLQAGTVASTAHITATAGAIQGTAEVIINPGPPGSLAVSASPSSISTVGGQTATITVSVTDQYGNIVAANTPVTFTTNLGNLNGGGSSAVVNTVNGQASAILAGTIAGTATITVSSGGLSDSSQQVYLAPGPPTHLSIQASPNAIAADGASNSSITVQILDQHDNPIDSSMPVTITTSLGVLTGGGTSYSETTSDGEVQVTLTAITQTGTAIVAATAAGYSTDTVVNFFSGPPASITLTHPPALVADGLSTAQLTATAFDAFGNVVGNIIGQTITYTFAVGDGTLLDPAVDTTANGILMRRLRSSTTLGTVPITVSVSGLVTPTVSSIEFIVGPPSSVDVSLTPTPPVTAGIPVDLDITVRDSVNHVVPNIPLTITTSLGTISPTLTGNTDSGGQLQRTLVSTQSGNATLSFYSYNGWLSNQGVLIVPDVPTRAVLAADPTEIIADGETTATIAITVTDQYGNPVPGVVPDVFTTLGSLSGSGATDSAGQTTRVLQSSTTLGAALIGVNNLSSPGTSVNFVTGPPYTATLNALEAAPYYVYNAGLSPDRVTMAITVIDKVGHQLVGQTFSVTSTIGTVNGAGCGFTGAGGVLTCTIYSTQTGTPTVYVEGVATTGEVITFNPGPLDHITIDPRRSTPATALPVSAGVPFTFTATAYDKYNNPRPESISNWSASTVDTGTGTVSNGVFVGQSAGKMIVVAELGAMIDFSYVNIGPGAPAMASIEANPDTVMADGVTSSQLALQVKDIYGNPVGSGFLPLVDSSIGIVEGTGVTNGSGLSTSYIRSFVAGAATISVSNLITLTGDTVVTFTAGVPAKALITATDTELPANGTDTTDVNITVLDINDNPVSAGHQIGVMAPPGTISCANYYTDAGGTVYCTLTAPLVESTTSFTILYLGMPLTIAGGSDTVSFVVGPLSRLEITPPGPLSLVAGEPITFTAQGYDAEDAPIPNDRLDFTWFKQAFPGEGNGDGTFSPADQPETTFTGTKLGANLSLRAIANDKDYSVSRMGVVPLTVMAGPPVSANVLAGSAAITADGASVLTLTLTSLEDPFGNDSPEGTPITVTVHSLPVARVSTGAITGSQLEVVITSTIRAGTYPISATSPAGDMSLTGDTSVTFSPGSPDYANIIAATPSNIVADGVSTGEIVLQVFDMYGNTVQSGLSLPITTTLGTILPGGDPTDSNGVLTRTLEAGLTLGDVAIGVDGMIASGLSTAMVPGPPVEADVTVITPTLTAGGQSTLAIFNVRDNWNHPVADGTIITATLTPTNGAFSGNNLAIGGVVTQTLSPGTSVGTVIVGAEGITVTGDITLTIEPGPAAMAFITANPTSLDVAHTTAITITITDIYSNIVPPTAITLTSVLSGTFEGAGATITKTSAISTGLITTTLSSTKAGTETLALSGPDGPLTIHPTSDAIGFLPNIPPQSVALDPVGPITVTAGIPVTITASSLDNYGNAVDPWLPVDYTWYQISTSGQPGYGTITALDAHGRTIKFLPKYAGPNMLQTIASGVGAEVISVNVVAGSPARATVAVNPDSVPVDGIGYVITLTQIADIYGNQITDGTPLTLTVQADTPVVGVGTSSGGTMIGVLTSTTQAGVHPITVEGPGGPLTLSGETAVTFSPGPPIRASITATPDTIAGDGLSTASLTVTIQDQYLNPVADGVPITVTTSLGTISGSSPTVNGAVIRTLHAPVGLGTADFTVEGPDGPLFTVGDSVDFIPGSPVYATVMATPVQVLADGVSQSQLTITIKDGNGFTVDTSETAMVSAGRGSLNPTSTVASNGVFSTTFTSVISTGPAGLSVTYDGVGPLAIVGDNLELIPGPAISATVAANPTSVEVGTAEQSTLTISVFDLYGNPVADGTVVTVTTSLGSILPSSSTTVDGAVTRTFTPGNTIGTATFSVKASPSVTGLPLPVSGDSVDITAGDLDHIDILPAGSLQVSAGSSLTFTAVGLDAGDNPAGTGLFTWNKWIGSGDGILSSDGVFTGTIAGTVGVQASQATIFSPIRTVTIVPGPPITAVVSATPITVAVGGASSQLTITARDAYGNLVADGTVLNLTSNLGTIAGASTTQGGVLTRTLISGNYPGTADIYVNGWEAGGDKVIFAPRAWVTPSPTSLPADGASQAVLNIKVYDMNGSLVPDGTEPTITTSLGTLSNCGSTVGGILTCQLQASLTPGVAQIYVNGMLAIGEVPFTVGSASVAYISASPNSLIADGVSTSTLTIEVQDVYGHVITNAGTLTVTTSRGTISGLEPTVNGVTTRLLTSDAYTNTGGVAIISVAGLSPAGDWKIHFIDETVEDGDFEDGTLENWTVGRTVSPPGASLAYSATVLSSDTVGGLSITSAGSGQMVRLGATTPDNSGHAVSEVWLSQPVYVQADGVTQVTFWYRLLSYDVSIGSAYYGSQEWDPFEVYLNGQEVLQDGFTWSTEWQDWRDGPPDPPPSPKDTGWKQGVLDLTAYAGQVVTMEFRVPNRQDAVDNTWVYLDDINVAHVELETHSVFLPLVLH